MLERPPCCLLAERKWSRKRKGEREREWKRGGKTKGRRIEGCAMVVGSLSRLADGTGSNSGEEKLRGSGDLGETTELVETMVGRDEGERPSTDPPHPCSMFQSLSLYRSTRPLNSKTNGSTNRLVHATHTRPRPRPPFSPPYLQTDFTCTAQPRNYIASIHIFRVRLTDRWWTVSEFPPPTLAYPLLA